MVWNWFRPGRSRSVVQNRLRRPNRPQPWRPTVEPLENRCLPAILVSNTNDSGLGSLRQAIVDANANGGPDTIEFNIPTTDPGFVDVDSALAGGDAAADAFVIQPLSALPALTDDGTTIDGRTQTAFTGDTNPFGPEVVIDGGMEPLLGDLDGFKLLSNDNQLWSLNIQAFPGDGIQISGSNNWVGANYIGTDATGRAAAGNGRLASGTRSGILIIGGASSNLVGTNGDGVADESERNVISANARFGILLTSGEQNVIAGNFIGTDASGTAALGNGLSGIEIRGPRNRVGTNGDGVGDVAERNVIAGNARDGVRIQGDGTDHNVVAGNFIGTDVTGTLALGNIHGVNIFNGASFNVVGTDGSPDCFNVNERNVISGNGDMAVHLTLGASNNVVAGNYLGTDVTGMAAMANGAFDGAIGLSFGANNTRIGTNADGVADEAERNVISGNGSIGINNNLAANGTVIAGNFIGTDATGTGPLGNEDWGITVFDAQNVRIGSDGDGVADQTEGNTIAFNGRSGVTLFSISGAHASIRGNSIHSNAELGIDLDDDGVTANDAGDADTGSNNLQNFPVVSLAESGALTHVVGTLHSTPNATFTIDFYANTAADPSGHGEGERWLGFVTVTTDAFGNASFDVSTLPQTLPGEFLTTTATDVAGNTSEFSLAVSIQATVEFLETGVEALVASGTLNEGQGKALQAPLAAAQNQIDKENTTAAINQLGAFINMIHALLLSGVLEEDDADQLLYAANLLVAQLSG